MLHCEFFETRMLAIATSNRTDWPGRTRPRNDFAYRHSRTKTATVSVNQTPEVRHKINCIAICLVEVSFFSFWLNLGASLINVHKIHLDDDIFWQSYLKLVCLWYERVEISQRELASKCGYWFVNYTCVEHAWLALGEKSIRYRLWFRATFSVYATGHLSLLVSISSCNLQQRYSMFPKELFDSRHRKH